MPRHIGIVACSAEGAALCYRTICAEGPSLLGPHNHPPVSLHTHPLAEYMAHIDRNDWEGVGRLMISSACRLEAAGAEFLICPDNTIHRIFPYVTTLSPLPWLHIADSVIAEAKQRNFTRIGIMGTDGWWRAMSIRTSSMSAVLVIFVPRKKNARS